MTQPNLNPLDVARLHQRSDLDGQPSSQHHTLGSGQNQASPGNHRHNGRDSPKLYPNPPVITGSRGGNVALENLLNSLAQLGVITNNTTAT